MSTAEIQKAIAIALFMALAVAACSPASGSSGSSSGSSSSNGCSKAHTMGASCSSDSDCYSNNCFEGSCYVGPMGCSSESDCSAYAPNSSYAVSCVNDSTKHGCAIYCYGP